MTCRCTVQDGKASESTVLLTNTTALHVCLLRKSRLASTHDPPRHKFDRRVGRATCVAVSVVDVPTRLELLRLPQSRESWPRPPTIHPNYPRYLSISSYTVRSLARDMEAGLPAHPFHGDRQPARVLLSPRADYRSISLSARRQSCS